MNLLQQLEQEATAGTCTIERFCSQVAGLFGVREHEVAVLTLKHAMLQFAYPQELRTVGMIPLMSSALAAKTATSKAAEIFNNFANIRHNSIFESVKIGGAQAATIQKLMSAPMLDRNGQVQGVMQVSRKGKTMEEAGADFTASDLRLLQDVARVLGRVSRNVMERVADSGSFASSSLISRS